MDTEYLLTATPSARKSLDPDAPVDIADIRECLRIGLQAANGSNQHTFRPARRHPIDELVARDAWHGPAL